MDQVDSPIIRCENSTQLYWPCKNKVVSPYCNCIVKVFEFTTIKIQAEFTAKFYISAVNFVSRPLPHPRLKLHFSLSNKFQNSTTISPQY